MALGDVGGFFVRKAQGQGGMRLAGQGGLVDVSGVDDVIDLQAIQQLPAKRRSRGEYQWF